MGRFFIPASLMCAATLLSALLLVGDTGCFLSTDVHRTTYAHARVQFWYPHGTPFTLALSGDHDATPPVYVAPYWVRLDGFTGDPGEWPAIVVSDSTNLRFTRFSIETSDVQTFDSLAFRVLDKSFY